MTHSCCMGNINILYCTRLYKFFCDIFFIFCLKKLFFLPSFPWFNNVLSVFFVNFFSFLKNNELLWEKWHIRERRRKRKIKLSLTKVIKRCEKLSYFLFRGCVYFFVRSFIPSLPLASFLCHYISFCIQLCTFFPNFFHVRSSICHETFPTVFLLFLCNVFWRKSLSDRIVLIVSMWNFLTCNFWELMLVWWMMNCGREWWWFRDNLKGTPS